MGKKYQSITGGSAKSIKPRKSRQLINRFHYLVKSKRQVEDILGGRNVLISSPEAVGDVTKASNEQFVISEQQPSAVLLQILARISAEIAVRGGLKLYQVASLNGQTRGSDSSKKLVEWLGKPLAGHKYRALEIGCLSSRNKISRWFDDIVRIDLNSQEPDEILQQDFMTMAEPQEESEKFDLVSLSLVLNFVPTAAERGAMLKKICRYFKQPVGSNQFPSLFFVLPLPCVTNSKYVDKAKLYEIMEELNFEEVQYYESSKLVYMLWKYNGPKKKIREIKKQELPVAKKFQRNNFAIAL